MITGSYIIGDNILLDMNKKDKKPIEIQVTTETFILLHGDLRVQSQRIDDHACSYFCSIPLSINDNVKNNYKLIYRKKK